ncbi:PD-(D/E)XK nuclease family protein [Halalkalibacterium ligniniphilum]|uniref:PD-(D/E)XK nuclease family protein n=1 Tax=Halalkalibacterium ligniniphilum TaxID=1134413 RepID=UPI0003469E75|nr:PD-(D/E)XK nuclease family protein [Halalkalibacterium ligniniphilum]
MGQLILKEINNQLSRMKDIYPFIKDENNQIDDSVITILGKKFHDENAISDYLAYILNSDLNGIGSEPLSKFLELIDNPIHLTDSDHVNIQREYTLPNNRRIDFLITINEETIIAIEHKVFSGEHGDQTWDYEKQINQLFSDKAVDVTYVFLSPNGIEASNPTFIAVSYQQLISALKEVKVDFIGDIRKAVLFKEIIFHLEGYFLNNKSIALSDKASLYLDHYEMIQDLSSNFEKYYNRVFQYIESVINNYFIHNIDEGEWVFDFKKDRSYHQIYKPHWKTKDINIHFEVVLSRDSFIKGELSFLLDIEGKSRKVFKEKHDLHLKEKVLTILNNNEILYRKGKRADTFASKTYHFLNRENLKDESLIEIGLKQMIGDFEGFIGPIEQELKCFYDN